MLISIEVPDDKAEIALAIHRYKSHQKNKLLSHSLGQSQQWLTAQQQQLGELLINAVASYKLYGGEHSERSSGAQIDWVSGAEYGKS